ncbi:hypothetical protein SAMN05421819_3935 [Bryocella elongata]|uniref:Uncharacterized protein n=1 Tax=Bryocella elongata TaxID=863522 RepID=A0A1H6BQK8_9BACT|nr:BrnT family toxin [Bryocella elongata]SEG62983.1 hypothetical protein SAMN05421819_3935 [Bryocella elongata]
MKTTRAGLRVSCAMPLAFEYDPSKATSNLEKHGASLAEAMTVFADPFAETFPDELHSEDEDR